MTPHHSPTRGHGHWRVSPAVASAAALILGLASSHLAAQVGLDAAAVQSPPKTAQGPADAQTASPVQTAAQTSAGARDETAPRSSDRRKAAKLYLDASKLFLNSQFEEARQGFEKAAALDDSNNNYRMAAEVARSHEVTALIQAAAKDRLAGNEAGARDALSRAIALDPKNAEASQHLDELAVDAARSQTGELYERGAGNLAAEPQLLPSPARHTFHQRGFARSLIEQVFQAYGIKAMVDDSVQATGLRIDLDDVSFDEASNILGLLTKTFYVALDAKHAVVARDTREMRTRFMRQELETVYLTGLNDTELKDVENIAKNAFAITQVSTATNERTMTLRAPSETLNAFNGTIQSLLAGKNQVVLEVKIIQVAHTGNRNTGLQIPQTFTAFNVYAEEQSLLSQNQALVQQIISSGLASANDPLAILGILIASGQVSSSLLSQGFAVFGGGLTQSALSAGATTINLSLNTSDSRELDDIQLRLEDGEKGTLKEGSRYPIQTSTYSSLSPNLGSIPGLTGAGTSGSLSSLLSSLTSTVPSIPMVQYEDLGLTLSATPAVLRSQDVALSLEMKLDALSGTSIDGNPVLANRAYSGVITLKEGEAAVVATEVDKSQSLAISGTPGISEIPGLNDVTGKNLQQDYATIVIVMTPHVIRGPHSTGHTAMMRVEKSGGS